ncbi:MAG: aspartate--tRNA ligase [Candidatus Omnitrophica bacterium 4484_70.2]|nr:MAG: aspartate--tRNA ligase [Candidatus Omnitrophica bacterium 4484_70.2]
MLRTHTCGQLDRNNIGEEVTLCGWVASRRDHGKIIFIDLRDRYGKTQVVFLPSFKDAYKKAKKLKNEDVIRIKGKVNPRPKGTENPKISTGGVEVCGEELEILNSSLDLPFSIEEKIEVSEDTRLYHRYLDLRRKPLLDKFILRSHFNYKFREYLHKCGFLEIETPYLTKSTPEGARDFLVPSRLNQGKFYALPQSPQLFKQILMVAGVDKYYQIVRCFRDEDLRKDRQPEFTQLDIELSFIEEEDIYNLVEDMLKFVFKEVLGIELKTPFLRIKYEEAMKNYSTDKPDIGKGEFRFLWVYEFPLFEYNQQEQRWQALHHPFTMPSLKDIELLDKNPSLVKARSYDLVLNGVEVASGSIRIHDPQLQKKIFSLIKVDEEEAERKFGFLLRALSYGAPPHGGIAFGLDRLYAIITKSESIREVIGFPKTQKGVCMLTEAPSEVEKNQLEELGIETKEKEEK